LPKSRSINQPEILVNLVKMQSVLPIPSCIKHEVLCDLTCFAQILVLRTNKGLPLQAAASSISKKDGNQVAIS